MDKLIITAAITGAELDRSKCSVLPMTANEQAIAARDAVAAGASVIHLHVRDAQGKPSQELTDFKTSMDAIRKACKEAGLGIPLIQFSTGGAVGEAMGKRIAPLSLKPEMASFNLGTMNFGEEIFVNTFSEMRALAKAFQEYGVVPEYEIYDAGHVDNLRKLIKEGIVKAPFHCQFVLGVPGAMSGDISALVYLSEHLPPGSTWGVAGIGRFELPLSVHAIVMGGNVRVGLEDNVFYSKGIPAESNAQLVERITRIATDVGRPVATPEEARRALIPSASHH